MEQEWTEDEEPKAQAGDLDNSKGENSGTEMDDSKKSLLDPNLEPEQASEEEVEVPRRRSTRKSKKIVLQSPKEEDESFIDTEGEKDDQMEWKPMEKGNQTKTERKKRKRKAPMTVDRRKRERDRERRNRMKTVQTESLIYPIITKKPRSRGRPRKEPIHYEGEYDIYDEDKTPEDTPTPANSTPKLPKKVLEPIHVRKFNDNDEIDEKKQLEEPNSPSNGSGPTCSVAMFGLEDEDEESDEDRTLSADPADYDQNDVASNFDPEEILISSENPYRYQYPYSMDEDDENTQYSVEAELARYAREDALMELQTGPEGNFDFHEEEDPEIEQELEKLTNINETEMEYYMVEENGEKTYYAIPKIEEEEIFERPIPPMEFDPDQLRQDPESEERRNYERSQEFKNGVENSESEINGNLDPYYGDDEELQYPEEMPESPAVSEASTIELTMGQLSIGGEVVEVPDIMLENEGVFRHILSLETFYSLSEEQQTHLKRLLPRGLDDDETVQCISSALVHNPNHYFGSPLSRTFNRIRTGFYNVDRPMDLHQLQNNRRVWYDHFIRRHYMKLLRTLVLARHAILEQAASLPDNVPIKIDPTKFVNIKKRNTRENVRLRAKIRARMMINFAAEKGPEDSESSDESDLEYPLPSVTSVPEAESSVFSLDFDNIDLDMYQPERMRSVKEMLKAHKALKRKNPDCPSLDFEGIALEDVYERSGLSFQSERNFLQLSSKEEIFSKKRRKRKRKTDLTNEQPQLGPFDLPQIATE